MFDDDSEHGSEMCSSVIPPLKAFRILTWCIYLQLQMDESDGMEPLTTSKSLSPAFYS